MSFGSVGYGALGILRQTRCLISSQAHFYSIQAPRINSTSSKPTKPSYFRVTLFRSPIGLPKRRRDSLVSLGLHRRMDVSYHRHSPDAAGLILSVKELLKVENVTEAEFEIGRHSSRKLIADDRGYRLIRNILERE